MGSLRERPEGSGRWQLRVHAGDGAYISKTVIGSERAAKKELARMEVAIEQRRAPKPSRETVAALLEDWWAHKPWASVGGRRQARDDLDRYLIPHLGDIVLARLTDRQIAELYRRLRTPGPECLAKRGKPLAPATLRRLHVNLHSALNWGTKKGRLGRNPASIVDVPAVPPTTVRGPETDDLQRLVKLAAEPLSDTAEAKRRAQLFGAFVRVIVATGRRREDVLGLTVADLRPGECAIVFDKRAVLGGKGVGVVIEALDKNARSARVDVDPGTMQILEDVLRLRRDDAKAAGGVLGRQAFLFSDDPIGAEPWRPDSTSRMFRTLRDAAGLPDVTLHSLRHAHVTELLERGLDVEAVAKRIGDNVATVYNVYAHARRISDRRAASIMGAMLDGTERRLIVLDGS